MARDELDEWFKESGIRELRRRRAQAALDKKNKRAVIIRPDGTVSINCTDRYEDRRLGFKAGELDVRGATRCRTGRKAGTPIYMSLSALLRSKGGDDV